MLSLHWILFLNLLLVAHCACASPTSSYACMTSLPKPPSPYNLPSPTLRCAPRKRCTNCHVLSRRRIFIDTALITSCIQLTNRPAAASASTTPQPQRRVEGIGGGFDILSPDPSNLSSWDVYYPASMTNTNWKIQRVVTSVEGDVGQARVAWNLLGGSNEQAFTSQLTEVYHASFVTGPNAIDAAYEFDGKMYRAAVLDRSSAIASRLGVNSDNIQWNNDVPQQTVTYKRNQSTQQDTVELTVVQRKIERPTEAGFGSDELIKIKSNTRLGGNIIDRVSRVKTRYRRGFDETTGKRIMDGIEIVTTYRVLDGVAGVEMPTSTCKSRIRLTEL